MDRCTLYLTAMAAFHLFFLVLAFAVSNSISTPLGAVARFDLASTNSEAVKQVKQALAANPHRWKPIFTAVKKAMDGGADDRSREEASSELKVLLHRELGPCPNCLKRDLGMGDL
ncbi:hypothetical protein VPH35_063848 [Triticum aestivum]